MADKRYADLHEHLNTREAAGLLVRVEQAINKDTEMHPLVRWQFRGGIAEKDRRAFLFTHVIDGKGRKHHIPAAERGRRGGSARRPVGRGAGRPAGRWTRCSATGPTTPR